MFSSALLPAALLAAVASVRAVTDTDVLQYALTLEHLEATFYAGGLAKFGASDFASVEEYTLFEQIASHEATHVATLQSVIGPNATQACNYTFPYTDVQGFKALAMVLESVGTSAYLGAAGDIESKAILTAAGSILAVEARHAAWLATTNDKDPWAGPFETPLGMAQVVSLASPFIVSCPSTNPPLGVKPFPTLTVSGNSTNLTAGMDLKLTVPADFNATSGNLFAAFLTGTTVVSVPYKLNQSVTIPSTVTSTGLTFVVISNSNMTATDDTTVAGPAILMFAETNGMNATSSMNSTKTGSSASASGTPGAHNASTGGAERTVSGMGVASLVMLATILFL